MKIAYVRVSTVEQNEERQIEGLEKHGIEKWYKEKVSGKNTDRPELQRMLSEVQQGDIIYVHDFSRLARSISCKTAEKPILLLKIIIDRNEPTKLSNIADMAKQKKI